MKVPPAQPADTKGHPCVLAARGASVMPGTERTAGGCVPRPRARGLVVPDCAHPELWCLHASACLSERGLHLNLNRTHPIHAAALGPTAVLSRLQEPNASACWCSQGPGLALMHPGCPLSCRPDLQAPDRAFQGRDAARVGPGCSSLGTTPWRWDPSVAPTARAASNSERATGPHPGVRTGHHQGPRGRAHRWAHALHTRTLRVHCAPGMGPGGFLE